MAESNDIKVFNVSDVNDFVFTALNAVHVREDVAKLVTEGLLSASIRGVDSHGIRLLPHYMTAVESGRINPDPQYKFERTASATGVFDADNTFGHAVGIEAMRKSMVMAREAGAGLVAVCNSSHCGTSAFFALEAAKNDFIGLAFTHANALLNTPNSTRPFFGLNPIAMAVPCEDEEPFCYDSAPSVITWNKLLQLRQEGLDAPPLSGADKTGTPANDPNLITQLLPIGGYKGFGLAMMVDIVCGLLTGMSVGRDIPDMYNTPLSQKRHLGQFYVAIKIDTFQPRNIFKERVKKLLDDVRNEPRRSVDDEVMVPGDPEKRAAERCLKEGIPISKDNINVFEEIAEKYNIKSIE